MNSRAVTFAAVLPALLVAHNVADHWLQTDRQATNKGLPGWAGRTACAAHVTTYTATTAATVGLLRVALDLPISSRAFLAGQAVSAATHYWADRRFTLARLCDATGKGGFYRLGAPRDGSDDNPTLGTGAYVLDQSWHWAWLGVAALITAAAS
ncbi:MAG: DUF3307 domain-containing protein [Pseudonocardiaceae bacterium]